MAKPESIVESIPGTRPKTKPTSHSKSRSKSRSKSSARSKPKTPTLESVEARLRDVALAYRGAVEEFPWGERVFKVNKKIFLFLGVYEQRIGITVKLPETGSLALSLPFVEPTGYNLGKSGWVSARFEE